MKTTNLVSTPNITGNIGSCTTQVVEIPAGRGFWVQDYIEVSTNSCTGEVAQYENWGFTGSAIMVSILVMFLLIAIISVAADN